MAERAQKRVNDEVKAHKPRPKATEETTAPAGELAQRLPAGGDQAAQILALQQTVGNKAVTGLIQRHSKGISEMVSFWVKDNKDGHESWMRGGGS